MQEYSSVSSAVGRLITKRYSTSFSLAILALPRMQRRAIYNIYGLVRIADEIVDTYTGNDQLMRLKELQAEVDRACSSGYSVNPVVQAFADTAQAYNITAKLYRPFFLSMSMDVEAKSYDVARYEKYIYGSACVVGLMCLRVFTSDNETQYGALEAGATALGSAFQKVNFLRDFADDTQRLGRSYFPNVSGAELRDDDKAEIVADIEHDFNVANPAIRQLPWRARVGVRAAQRYYNVLLNKLNRTPAVDIMQQRVRVNNLHKLAILFATWLRLGL